jgi:hypothetical protein
MANNKTESFIGALCVSWVFYRDAQQRDDRGNTVYHSQFFARVSAPNQDTFIMRMSSEWFVAARSYTDSPSLGRCVHHARGTTIKMELRKQVHQPKFSPKDWEFEVLTKLKVLGQQPAQTQEPSTYEITFLGPTLSTFDSPSEHHCAGIPKSKGERSNPTKRAGKLGKATNDPRKKVKASAFMVQRDESKEEIEAPYRPIQDVPVPSPTKPTFTTRHTHANEGIITQLTYELVTMHIGQRTHKSATMLVDSGASHILVRQERTRVDQCHNEPKRTRIRKLKIGKEGVCTLGNWKRRLTNRTLLPTGVHTQQRRVRGHTPRTGPFNQGRMHSGFQQGIISTVPRIEHGTCPIRREEAQPEGLESRNSSAQAGDDCTQRHPRKQQTQRQRLCAVCSRVPRISRADIGR